MFYSPSYKKPLFALGLPLCSLGIMKDAWDRLRQCISPSSTMSHYSNNTLPILNQMFHFVYGSLPHLSPSSTVFSPGQSCSQADPKSITFAIMQQQQRAEVIQIFLLYDKLMLFVVGPKWCSVRNLKVSYDLQTLSVLIRCGWRPCVRCQPFCLRWKKRAVNPQHPTSFLLCCSLCSCSSCLDALP